MEEVKVALIYDFDKTLSINDMQAFEFFNKLGETEDEFWGKCGVFSKEHNADRILAYMYVMIAEAKKKGIDLTRDFLVDCGKSIELYKGVETWFDRINEYGRQNGITVEHYVVSSGLKEMIEGTNIAKFFKEVYAGNFVYDETNHPIWPALAINYTNKTQFIYRINKGILNVTDDTINNKMAHDIRPVPFENMIYIGDSGTDIPCMRLIMKSGGYSVGVYSTENNKKYLHELISDNRINFMAESDYTEGGELENIVKQIILTVKHKETLVGITESQKNKRN